MDEEVLILGFKNIIVVNGTFFDAVFFIIYKFLILKYKNTFLETLINNFAYDFSLKF